MPFKTPKDIKIHYSEFHYVPGIEAKPTSWVDVVKEIWEQNEIDLIKIRERYFPIKNNKSISLNRYLSLLVFLIDNIIKSTIVYTGVIKYLLSKDRILQEIDNIYYYYCYLGGCVDIDSIKNFESKPEYKKLEFVTSMLKSSCIQNINKSVVLNLFSKKTSICSTRFMFNILFELIYETHDESEDDDLDENDDESEDDDLDENDDGSYDETMLGM